jgi:putative ABC transport system substrate-binding protein
LHRRRALAAFASLAIAPALAETRLRMVRRIQRVAIVFYGTPANSRSRRDAFVNAMRELGYEDGRNVRFDWRYANGQPDLVVRNATQLSHEIVDVVVSFSAINTEALRDAGISAPVVMSALDDPVRSGFAHELARPGTNFTGLTTNVVAQASRYLELLLEAVGKASVLGLLASPASSTYQLFRSRVDEAAARRGVHVASLDAATPEEIDRVLGRGQPAMQGLIVTSDTLFYNERRRIVELANEARLPAIYPRFGYVEVGGLMSYAPNDERLAARAAKFVARIIEGEAPEAMPIEGPIVYELAVNRRAAKSMALELPSALIKKADRLVG